MDGRDSESDCELTGSLRRLLSFTFNTSIDDDTDPAVVLMFMIYIILLSGLVLSPLLMVVGIHEIVNSYVHLNFDKQFLLLGEYMLKFLKRVDNLILETAGKYSKETCSAYHLSFQLLHLDNLVKNCREKAISSNTKDLHLQLLKLRL